jgi:hypothetical protein
MGTFYESCRVVNQEHCNSLLMAFCPGDDMNLATCIANCSDGANNGFTEYCGGRPAKENGKCVSPAVLQGEFYCMADGTTKTTCSDCKYMGIDITTANVTTGLCEPPTMPPVANIPEPLFWCEIEEWYDQNNVVSKKLWVEDCWSNCSLSKKEKVWSKGISDYESKTCFKASVETCKEMNLVHCPGGGTLPYGSCVPACDQYCYITVNDQDNINSVFYEPQFYDDGSGSCIDLETKRDSCLNNNKFWCGASGTCLENSCDECRESDKQYDIARNEGTGFQCESNCGANASYCPSTSTCVECTTDSCMSNCDHCHGMPMQIFQNEPAGSSKCEIASEELCKEKGMDFCEYDKSCKNRYHEKSGDGNSCLSCGNGKSWSPGNAGTCTEKSEVIAQCESQQLNYMRLPGGYAQCVSICSSYEYCSGEDGKNCKSLEQNTTAAICNVERAMEGQTHVVVMIDSKVNSTMAGRVVDFDSSQSFEEMADDVQDDETPMHDYWSFDEPMDSFANEWSMHTWRRRLRMLNGNNVGISNRETKFPPTTLKGDTSMNYQDPVNCALYEAISLAVICSKTPNAPECNCDHDDATTLPLSYDTEPMPFCESKQMYVQDCSECDCQIMHVVKDGMAKCANMDPPAFGCDDPIAKNYDRCASTSSVEEQLSICDYNFGNDHLTPNVKLYTNQTYNITTV